MGLFKPAWMGKNLENAQKAVEKESDKKKLIEISMDCPHPSVRYDAMLKADDQPTIAYIAMHDKDRFCRQMAVQKLADQTALAHVVILEDDLNIQRTAIEKLTDQAAIAEVAMNLKDDSLRGMVVREKLTNQSVLANIARHDSNGAVRKEAVKKLTDLATLACVAKNDCDADIRCLAFSKIYTTGIMPDKEIDSLLAGIINIIYSTRYKTECLQTLIKTLSPDGCKKFGIEIEKGERETEDQYGRYTGNYALFYYKGNLLCNLYAES